MEELLKNLENRSLELRMLCETMERVSSTAFDDGIQAEDISNALYMPLLMLSELQVQFTTCCHCLRREIKNGGDAA